MAARESKFRSALRDSSVPRDFHYQLIRWVEHGEKPRDRLLQAIIANDTQAAIAAGLLSYPSVAQFLHHHAPEGSCFSSAALANWPMHRRALARQAEATLAWAFRDLTEEDLSHDIEG
jgi:hypothetical protein